MIRGGKAVSAGHTLPPSWIAVDGGKIVAKGRLSLERAVALCSENPARRFGLYPKRGIIAVGSDTDFAIVDLNKTVKFTRDMVLSRL